MFKERFNWAPVFWRSGFSTLFFKRQWEWSKDRFLLDSQVGMKLVSAYRVESVHCLLSRMRRTKTTEHFRADSHFPKLCPCPPAWKEKSHS